jgi:PEP-CTERM motif
MSTPDRLRSDNEEEIRMNIKQQLAAVLGALCLCATTAAGADALYSNPVAPYPNMEGDCLFNTACAGQAGYKDVFEAQEFTLSSTSVLTSGSFYNETLDPNFLGNVKLPSAINWIILSADGSNGLPATVIARGNTAILSSQSITLPGLQFDPLYEEGFLLPSVDLSQGTYYFALQALGSDVGVYLSQGIAPAGEGAITSDGGATWFRGLNSINSAAITLEGTTGATGVPEPGSLALFLLGLAALGSSRVLQRFPARCNLATH